MNRRKVRIAFQAIGRLPTSAEPFPITRGLNEPADGWGWSVSRISGAVPGRIGNEMERS